MRVDKTDPHRLELCQRCKFQDVAGDAYPCMYCWNPMGDMFVEKHCECLTWARCDDDELAEPPTAHHPRCPKHRKLTFLQLTANGNTCTMEPREAAHALVQADDQSEYTVTAVQMSQERFDALPEFTGF